MSETKATGPKVTVYSKDYCPYCDRAKSLLDSKGVAYEAIELQDDPRAFQDLRAKTGLMTVPQIFVGDKLIGGYDDLSEANRSGELDKLLGL